MTESDTAMLLTGQLIINYWGRFYFVSPGDNWDELRDEPIRSRLHREAGPAIEYSDGDYEYYVNGRLHRTDGPAIGLAPYTWWYIDGVSKDPQ